MAKDDFENGVWRTVGGRRIFIRDGEDLATAMKKSKKFKNKSKNANENANENEQLSKEQKEYFQNSKIRDDNGNLLEVYHVSNTEFEEFKGSNVRTWENGEFKTESNGLTYFTNNDDYIKGIEKNIKKGEMASYGYQENKSGDKAFKYKTYLNIEKPLDLSKEAKEMSPRKWQKLLKEKGIDLNDEEISKYSTYNMKYDDKAWNYDNTNFYAMIKNADKNFTSKLKEAGYDGIIYHDVLKENNVSDSLTYVTTNPNQIKSISNKKPTKSSNINK